MAMWTSPVQSELEQRHPRWATVNGRLVAIVIGDDQAERAAAVKVGICDVSTLTRLMVKGPAAAELLRASDVVVPQRIYDYGLLKDGGLCVRTGAAEFFIEDGWHGNAVARLRGNLNKGAAGVLPVWRQDISLMITGSEAVALLAQVCSFDFAATGDQFTLTQIAGVSCSVLRRDGFEWPAWQLWADGTYGSYLWQTLVEIARELGGDAVGAARLGAPLASE